MANLTNVEVGIDFQGRSGNSIKVDWVNPSKELQNFIKAFSNFSYQGDGYRDEGTNVFHLYGRWSFGGNFNWEEEIRKIAKAVKELGAYKVVGNYSDCDSAMDWLTDGWFFINADGTWYQDVGEEGGDYDGVAQQLGMNPSPTPPEYPEEPTEEQEKAYNDWFDDRVEWIDSVEELFARFVMKGSQ